MDQSLTTLLAALIGGTAAIAGGFIATYVTGKIAAKNERMVFVRSKLEEVYIILGEMQEVYDVIFQDMIELDDGESRTRANDNLKKLNLLLKRFEVITSLYMHDLHVELGEMFEILNPILHKINKKFLNDEKYTKRDREENSELASKAFFKAHKVLSSFAKRKGIAKI